MAIQLFYRDKTLKPSKIYLYFIYILSILVLLF